MRILIVKLSSLGDVVHTFPALSDVRAALGSTAVMDWAVEGQYAPLVALHPAIGKVIPVAQRYWRRASMRLAIQGLRTDLQKIRARRYDVVIDAQGLLKSALWGAWPARGPAHGFSFGSAREALAALFYGGGRYQISPHRHAIDRIRVLFARVLGYQEPTTQPEYGVLAKIKPKPRRSAVAFLHSSAQAGKLWPEQGWIELGREINAAGFEPELTWGSATERQRATRIAKACAGRVRGPFDLAELASWLATVAGAVGLDTGLTHLAAALEVPCVGLYLATDPARTGNRGGFQYCYGPDKRISAAKVGARLRSLIDEHQDGKG